MNFSVPRRQCAPPRRAPSVTSSSSAHDRAGWMLTSSTPGIGRDRELLEAVIGRRRVALEAHAADRARGRRPRSPRRAPGTPRGRRPAAGRRAACLADLDAERGAHQASDRARDRAPRGAGPWPLLGPLRRRPVRDLRDDAGERRPREQRIALVISGARLLGLPGQGVERQPEAHRRIAGDQEQPLAAQGPGAALPGDGPEPFWVRARSGST